jgi:pyruvyl transferase EpsO
MDKLVYKNYGGGNLTLVGRDQDSFEFLQTQFSDGSERSITKLSPDMAFMLGPQLQNCQGVKPKWDILFLLRRDNETTLDWSVLSHALSELRNQGISYAIEDWFNWREYFSPVSGTRLKEAETSPILNQPDFRLQAAKNMLCSGRVVVSNRLHAMILSLLLNQPFVGLDNSYGKLSLLRTTFFANDGDCAPQYTGSYFASDLQVALSKARSLIS